MLSGLSSDDVYVPATNVEVPFESINSGALAPPNALASFTEFIDPNPNPFNQFGDSIVTLGSGNVVVTSPFDDAGGLDAGAVYLFNGKTGALISTLIGSIDGAKVGSGGITVLTNGNYVIYSPSWHTPGTADLGAVTLGNGMTGVSGVVDASSSLVGSTHRDRVGDGGITPLTNGNYVVRSRAWSNGAVVGAGAVTFGNGTAGVTGEISASNSLVGSSAEDQIGGDGVTALNNGNYVVESDTWDNGAATDAGAVTFGDGTTGISGVISASNSLVGTTTNDRVGTEVTALSTGNYVVRSPEWFNGTIERAGAVTFGDGITGVSGVINVGNSLIGTETHERIGSDGVIALSTGNYVVVSPRWNNGSAIQAGAVTIGDGLTGISGVVSASNSLVGESEDDRIGINGITLLSNGNYVVVSRGWNNGTISDAGAVTFGNGTTGITGAVSSSNSLVGTIMNNDVGRGGVTELANGNYVVSSWQWDNGASEGAGAVTFGSGTTGVSGEVNAANSLIGTSTGDNVGKSGITLLSNGNYVVTSSGWDNGAGGDAGAATFGNGTTGVSGVVSVSNSLVGTAENDGVGFVVPLTNGNYVAVSNFWDNGALADVGAVTFGNGTTGISGVVSTNNSLVGTSVSDLVGNDSVAPLSNGNYVVISRLWNNGAVSEAGAVTFGNGSTGITGAVSASNSLVGTSTNDHVGNEGITILNNGNYVVSSGQWDNGTAIDAGAVTFGSGTTGATGSVTADNSLVGTKTIDRVGNQGITALNTGNYLVNSGQWDNGTAQNAGAVTFGNGTLGISGLISPNNSLIGTRSFDHVGNGGITLLNDDNFVVLSDLWDNGTLANAGAATFASGKVGIRGVIDQTNSVVGMTANAGIQPIVWDAGNELFYAGFIDEQNGGKVRVGETTTADLSVSTHGDEAGPINVVYTVTLSKTNDTGVAITFDLDDLFTGTAVSGSDYTAIANNAQISVADGASTGTLAVAVTDDGVLEVTETVIAQISNPSNTRVAVVKAAATGNIVDNETPDPPTGYSRSLAAGPGSAAPSLEVALGDQANSASVPDFTLVNQVIFADPTTAYATVGTPGAADGRIMRYDYDVATGTFSNAVEVFDVDAIGDGIPVPIGIGIHDGDLWISRFSGWPAPRPGVVTRLQDTNGDGIFDQHADFITGIILALPGETSHTINQIEINNGSLYVGIGTRTNDGSPVDELEYSGTIVRIPDLNSPIVTDLSDAAYRQGDFLDTSATDGRAHLFARGFRNPYGLRFDASGQLWVTDNGADAGTDDDGNPFGPTPDLIYKNVQVGDIARFPPPGSPGGGGHTIEPLAELDFNTAPAGFDIIPYGPDAGAALIGMTSGTNGRTVAFLESDGTGFDLDFFDLGSTAIEVIPDVLGRMLVFDRDNGNVYKLTSDATITAGLFVATQGAEAGPIDIVLTVMLSETNDTGAPITFDLDDLFTGTALSGTDYTAIAANAQISVAAGASTGTLTVSVTDDGLLESTETLVAQISNPSNAAVIIASASAVANIVDNEVPAPPPDYSRMVAASGTDFQLINQVIFVDPTTAYATVGTPGAADTRIMRYDYDLATGMFSNPVEVFDVDGIGDGMPIPIGIGLHNGDLWISRFQGFSSVRPGVVTRLRDTNNDGIFDQHTDFVIGIDLALPGETSHTINQIEIHNGSLYVGIGTRTNDGSPVDELEYSGTIVRIPDLSNPIVTDLSDAAYRQGDFLDTAATDGRAHLFASGFRNPYGLRWDASGQFWVSDNGADAGTDDDGNPFGPTPDLIYKNVQVGDVAKFPPPGSPGGGSHTIEPLAELDFNTAPAGFDIIPYGPDAGAVLIGMTSGTNGQTVSFLNSDGTGFDLNFFDIGATAIEVIPDSLGRMLIFDRDNGIVYKLTSDAAITAGLFVTTQGDESGPTDIVYTAMLSEINDTGVAITFDLDDLLTGTATSGTDYTAILANAQISIAPGASTGTLTVPVLQDVPLEGTETLIVQISNPSNAMVSIVTASATANISDDPTPRINLSSLNGATGFRLDGVATDDSSGFSVSGAGDVNGDGFDDVIIGARNADPNGGESGSSYVVFGRSGGFTSPIDLSSLNGTTGFRLDGVAADDRSGRSVKGAGDVNGDGFDDLIVGAWGSDPNGNASGSSYVVFGHSGPFNSSLNLSSLDGTTGFRLDGAAADDRSGLSVSGAGDVNGDGFDDVIVGAQLADPNGSNSGSSYVVFGHSGAFASSINLGNLNGTTGFRLDGVAADDRAGIWVRGAGDVNGDGFDDVLVGAFQADPNGSDSGSSYVVFGHSGVFAASTNLSTLNGTTGFRLDGVAATDHSGLAVSGAGDVNGDGFDDLIVAARETDFNGADSGSSYVVFGHSGVFAASTNLSSLNGTTGFRLDGVAAGDFAGFSVSDAGDVNGDGFDDLLVGAFLADPNGDASGSSYVVYGRTGGFASTINLSSLDATTGFRLDGVAAGDRSGVSVSSAGDVNGDGFDDLLIGADQADPNGNSNAGSSYVFFGSNLTGGVETQVGDAAANTLTATQGAAVDILIGGQGPDTLISDGGDDVLRGGEGDDSLSIPDTMFSPRRLLGGNGTDTLILAGSGLTLDLTTLADNRIVDIEEIDITGTGANTLTLDVREVLNLSTQSNTLIVRRDVDDTVNIGSGWTQQADEVIGPDTFEVFTQGAATLKVQASVVAAPRVMQVLVSSSGWSTDFKNTFLGSTGGFYPLPTDSGQLRSLAWEIDQVRVVFDQDVTISQDDMILTRGSNTSTPVTLQGFAQSGSVATWTIDPVSADKLLLNLNDQTISNAAGLALDGDFATGSGATQSGDGTPGGPFRFRINVLAADVDGSGQVDSGDVVGIGAAFLQTPGDVGWDPFADLDTSAQIDSGDVVPIGAFFLNALPADEPPDATFPAPLLALLNTPQTSAAPVNPSSVPDEAETVEPLETVTVTTVEPEVISPSSNQPSTENTSQVPLITLGRAGRERSGNAGAGRLTVSGKGMSIGQFTTHDVNRAKLRTQSAEQTTSTADMQRVNRQRNRTRSTWIDLNDSINTSDKDDREERLGRNGVAWHSFDDDQIQTRIKVGEKFDRLRD